MRLKSQRQYCRSVLTHLAQQVVTQDSGPKVTEIVTCVIASLALAAATWSANTSHKTSLRQAKQIKEAQDHDMRRQAAQVAAWSVPNMGEDGTQTVSTYIMNASNLPVFTLELTDGVSPTASFAVQEPTTEPRRWRVVNYDWSEDEAEPWEVRIAQLFFTDAEGNRWLRDHNGLQLLQRAKKLTTDNENR